MGKAAGPPGLVSEMVKAGGEGGVEMITDLVSQIIVEVIPAKWELRINSPCYKGKRDDLAREN